jgi:hypothetical protein
MDVFLSESFFGMYQVLMSYSWYDRTFDTILSF